MKTNNTPNHGAHCQLNFLYNENPYSPISSMFKILVFHALFLIFIRFGRKILPDLEYNQREMLRHLPRLINLEGGGLSSVIHADPAFQPDLQDSFISLFLRTFPKAQRTQAMESVP